MDGQTTYCGITALCVASRGTGNNKNNTRNLRERHVSMMLDRQPITSEIGRKTFRGTIEKELKAERT